MNKYGIDYNMSKHLEALLLSKNVTLAAKSVGITQSAMSNSLSKIRAHFNDEILVRTKDGYALTLLAEGLLPKVSLLIDQFSEVFNSSDNFNPLEDEYTFNIAVSDYVGYVFGPELLFHLQENFPSITVNLRSIDEENSTDDLSNGRIDLSIATGLTESFAGTLNFTRINSDCFGVAGCADHLDEIESLSIDDYIESTHLFTRAKSLNTNIVDSELAKRSLTRTIVGEVPSFSVAIRSTLRTPNLVTLPYKLLIESAKFLPLRVYELPMETSKIYNNMLWHGKTENHRPNVWLREIVLKLFKESDL